MGFDDGDKLPSDGYDADYLGDMFCFLSTYIYNFIIFLLFYFFNYLFIFVLLRVI